MRLLDRYLLRELLIPLAYSLIGFLIFWMTFDLFSNLEDFHDNHVPPLMVVKYYIISAPEFIVLVLPIGLLLSLLYALTNHARHNELTAIRAAGTSLWRMSAVYLTTGLVLTVVL